MSKGGARPGAGIKKGTKFKRTLEKEAVARAFRERVFAHADHLFHAQLSRAVGSVMVFRVDEITDRSGKSKEVHTLVTEPDEIKLVLDSNGGQAGKVGANYYFVTAVAPDNKAIDSLLDRALGRAVQSIEITESPELVALRRSIVARAEQKGISYAEELRNYLDNYAGNVKPEIKEKLSSELVQ